jgi:hypothetical protein
MLPPFRKLAAFALLVRGIEGTRNQGTHRDHHTLLNFMSNTNIKITTTPMPQPSMIPHALAMSPWLTRQLCM